MKQNHLLFAILIATLLGCTSTPQTDQTVWINPPFRETTFSMHNGGYEFNVLKVVLGETETTVDLKVSSYPSRSFTFDRLTTLKADGKSYRMLSIDGVTPGIFKPIGIERSQYVTFHFEPLPADTKSFDLIESDANPGAFNIYGIHRYDPNSLQLMGTHWRNVRSGNWTISFLSDYVIYDEKVWQYDDVLTDSLASEQDIVISHNGVKALVHIGAMKNGARRIRVEKPGSANSSRCELFESKNLGDFPVKTRNLFQLEDYGYENVDSVTISGIMIGPKLSSASLTFDVIEAIRAENPKYPFTTDENGFFSITFPLTNTSVAMARRYDGGGSYYIMVEPGQSYFVYENQYKDQLYVMGKRSRIQNENLAYVHELFASPLRIDETPFQTDLDKYLEYLIEWRDKRYAVLDSLLEAHPSISEGLMDMGHACINIDMYQYIGQSRFHNLEQIYVIPENIMDFMQKDMKEHSIKPYSLFYSFNYFMRDFTQNLYTTASRMETVTASDVINYVIKSNKVDLTADERQQLLFISDYTTKITAINNSGMDEKACMDSISRMGTPEMIEELMKADKLFNEKNLWQFANEYYRISSFQKNFDIVSKKLSGYDFEKSFKDMAFTHFMISQMDDGRHSLPAASIAIFDSIVTYKPCQDAVHKQNDKYLALENVDLANLGNVIGPDELAKMSDGEAILRKITEPYRGKIIYIDIWGSWCHPCLENLQHASELKAALKDYDIIYLYLASSTTDDAWKGIIKEYNLTGEDCVHYNLPAQQQALVEQFLKVSGYPTYRILNRHGSLIEGSFSPINLSTLKQTLNKL